MEGWRGRYLVNWSVSGQFYVNEHRGKYFLESGMYFKSVFVMNTPQEGIERNQACRG